MTERPDRSNFEEEIFHHRNHCVEQTSGRVRIWQVTYAGSSRTWERSFVSLTVV